jgi:hypothetical protein
MPLRQQFVLQAIVHSRPAKRNLPFRRQSCGVNRIDGKKFRTLRGPNIATEFKAMVIDYIDQRYGAGDKVPAGAVTAAE